MLALAYGLAFSPARAAPAEQAASCPAASTQGAVVAGVGERLDLVLTDGRSLHLAGLDPPEETPTQTSEGLDLPTAARDALLSKLTGAIRFLSLAPTPDRWGRIPAFVFFAPHQPDTPQKSVALFLLAHGFARFMPVPEAHACRDAFLAAEARARAAKLGLWRDPYYAILEATNRAAFTERGASNVIVEGRLAAATSDRYRMTLEFAPHRAHALAVTILQRNVAIFDRSGLDFHALIGRTLRVRGLLDLRFGPHIEISSIDDIELITDGQTQGGTAKRGETIAASPPTQHP